MVAVAVLTGCGGSGDGGDEVTVIDVRTLAEYAEGHLRGAVNIDVNSPDFITQVAALPVEGTYQVYCRSGVRSQQGVGLMQELGFHDVTDLGGLEDAARITGLPIVTV